MAAFPSTGPQQWAPWHGGQGVDVVVLHSRARCGRAESFPLDWKVQAETFPSSKCPVPAQGGTEPLHEVPQLRVSPAAVPDPHRGWWEHWAAEKSKGFLISELVLRNLPSNVGTSLFQVCSGAHQSELLVRSGVTA